MQSRSEEKALLIDWVCRRSFLLLTKIQILIIITFIYALPNMAVSGNQLSLPLGMGGWVYIWNDINSE